MSDDPKRSLLSAIADATADNMDKPAFICPVMGEVSYADFSKTSTEIAAELKGLGVSGSDRVVIFARRSAAVIISMHAVLSIGARYVPVAQGMPDERVSYIAEDCTPTVIICDAITSEPAHNIARLSGARVLELSISEDGVRFDSQPSSTTADHVETADSAGYILYTSGSTGRPKGVVVSHENILDYVDWATSHFSISLSDRILTTAPFYFDMSTFDIYVSLVSGATLVIASEKDCMFPRFLLRKIRDNGVTVWKAVSALFAHVASVAKLDSDSLASLRVLVFSGERLPTHYLIEWMSALPTASYYNAYGPTEATGISSCYYIEDVPPANEDIPIGKPCTNTEVYLFDDHTLIEEQGKTGEIVIGGPGVASGYWNDDAKTEKSFVRKIGRHQYSGPVYRTGDLAYFDENRDLVFVARVDRQIKHQGYRIELDDIESALCGIDAVSDAAVVHVADQQRSELVAYIEADTALEESEVRAALGRRIPLYMVPKRITQISSLPRTDRSKVDYEQLKASSK